MSEMGPKTEIGPRNPDFRSSLNSRHSPTRPSRPESATNGSEAARNHLYDAERYRSPWRVQCIGIAGNYEVRRPRRNDVAVSGLARVPDRVS